MNYEIINPLNIRRLFSVLMNLAHLVKLCNFKSPFLQSSFICLSKVKLLSVVMPRNFSLEYLYYRTFNIDGCFIKGDKNR